MKKVLLPSLFIAIILNSNVFAQLDPTFGSGGRADYSVGTGRLNSLAIQPDNKIVLMGPCTFTADWPSMFCIMRVNEDGTQDGTFMTRIVRHPDAVLSNNTGGAGMALQSDGKIVMSGYATFADGEKVVLMRLNGDGSTDNSFGTGGFVVTDIAPGANNRGAKVAIQPNGRIVIAGNSISSSTSFQGFVARYLPDGNLDSSFATGGVFTPNISGATTQLYSILIQPDGKIITGGSMQDSSAEYDLLARLNADGTLDTMWDGDGYKSMMTSPSTSNPLPGFVSIESSLDGKVAAMGTGATIYRFNGDGSADTSFDGDGVRASWYDNNNEAWAITVSASGRITDVGNRYLFNDVVGNDYILSIAKFLPDGSPDTSFSGDGYVFAGLGNDSGRAVALDSNGRTVVAGVKSYMPFPFAIPTFFHVVRTVAPPVKNVSISGRATTSDGSAVRNITIGLQNNGVTIATAKTNPFGYFAFANVATNKNYTVSIKARAGAVSFPAYKFFLDDEIVNFNIVGETANGLSEKEVSREKLIR